MESYLEKLLCRADYRVIWRRCYLATVWVAGAPIQLHFSECIQHTACVFSVAFKRAVALACKLRQRLWH